MSRKEKRINRSRSFWIGFKDFISKGNIVDLAIAVIIGAAFGKIVNSLVKDIIMPPIGLLLGNVNFSELSIVLKQAVLDNAGEVLEAAITINYGLFIQNIVEFLIVAFSIYLVITLVIRRKEFNARVEAEEKARLEADMKIQEDAKEVVIPEEIKLLTEIKNQLEKLNEKK